MMVRQRLVSLLSAAVFIAGTAFAATQPPPPPQPVAKAPAFSGLTLCQVTEKHELCCEGEISGLSTDAALVTIATAYQCQTSEPEIVHVLGVSADLKPVQGALAFEGVCIKAPTAQECPAQAIFAPAAQVSLEQPKGTVVLHGLGVKFP